MDRAGRSGVRRRLPGQRARSNRALTRLLEAREQQQAAVATLGQLALTLDDQPMLHAAAVTSVAETLELHLVNLVRSCPDGRLDFTATHGWAPSADKPHRGGGPVSRVLETGVPFVLDDTASLPEESQRALNAVGVHSSAAVPVGSATGLWGVLVAHASTPSGFSADDLHFLQSVANVVAAAAERAEVARELQFRASHDALTGLPGRELMHERLGEALATCGRDEVVGVLLIDLDDFKDVNDSLGHGAGDDLLQGVGARLPRCLGAGATLARLSGDEFAAVLRAPDTTSVAHVAEAVVAALAAPFPTSAGPVTVSGSVSVALAPLHGRDQVTLLRHADLAMYRAKRGRAGCAVYDPHRDEDPGARLEAVDALRRAIGGQGRHRLHVAYQPVVHLATGRVTAVEALARWNDPVHGPRGPGWFVPLAERSGLIGGLTDEITDLSLRQVGQWHRAGRELALGVNMPGSVLERPGCAERLLTTAAGHGVPLTSLRLEVTESTLVSDSAVATLWTFARAGVRIAIDDFGTGYSSLGRLKQLPVHTVKIDRSFVTGLAEDSRDRAIVRSVVALAEDLGFAVIAEAVETPEVAELLLALGVDKAQGYLWSRPVPAAELAAWHDAHLRTPLTA